MASFEEYIEQMVDQIPEEARQMLPKILSKNIQQRMMLFPPSYVANVINEAINEINRGSIERIENLIAKKI